MRILLGLLMLALGAFLIWHGAADSSQAAGELARQGQRGAAADYQTLHQHWPYSTEAILAREAAVQHAVETSGPSTGKAVDKEAWKKLLNDIPGLMKAVSGTKPYIQPEAAALIGLAGLLLALILPATRFRGLAFLGLVIGGAAIMCALLPVDSKVALVRKFSWLSNVIANLPRVAEGVLVMGGVALASTVSRGGSKHSNKKHGDD